MIYLYTSICVACSLSDVFVSHNTFCLCVCESVGGGGGWWRGGGGRRGEGDIECAGKAKLFVAASSPNSTKTRAKKHVS